MTTSIIKDGSEKSLSSFVSEEAVKDEEKADLNSKGTLQTHNPQSKAII